MKYYLIAGEASGDVHGANLMKALKSFDANASFRYYGGDKMQQEGGALVVHNRELAFMGFTEVILNIRTILRNLKNCKRDIENFNPDVLILIDYPGFNLKIAAFAKSKNIPVCYYISPKIWAWNQKRALKIKRNVDRMFCILPFEVDFYQKWGMEVTYVGNPILDEIAQFSPNSNFRAESLSEKKIVALLPGSRKQEIELLLPEMLKMVDVFTDYHFIIAGSSNFNKDYYSKFIHNRKVEVVFNSTYDLLSNAYAALVASGTATLETALFNVPQVVLYKGGAISIAIARMVIKVQYISLVNLIATKKIVTELIQNDCNQTNITAELQKIVEGKDRTEMLNNYNELQRLLGKPGASGRTAKLIYDFANTRLH